jgi:hypothetical protein
VVPPQIVGFNPKVMVGTAFIVTAAVVLLQLVVLLVNVNVADPPAKPATDPPLVTEAMEGLLLPQVPPEVGDSVVVFPAQMVVDPVMETTGKLFTVINPETLLVTVQLLLLVTMQ